MRRKPQSPLLLQTIDRLRETVAETNGSRLPTATVLAQQLGVSRGTVLCAARELRDKGILEFSRGRGLLIRGRRTAGQVVIRLSSDEAVAQKLQQSIAAGRLRAGRRLPKVLSIASQHNVSNSTAHKALRLLARENLVHKRGRVWVVGPTPAPVPLRRRRRATDAPVIAMLLDRANAWLSVLHGERTRKFAYQFDHEARRYGVTLEQVYRGEESAPAHARCIGLGNLKRLIKGLGSRYLGALIPSETRRFADLAEWAEALAPSGEPIVWFDANDNPPESAGLDRMLYRCHYAEEAAAMLAVRYLARHGHRRVVYAWAGGGAPPSNTWWERRWGFVDAAARKSGIEVACLPDPGGNGAQQSALVRHLAANLRTTAVIVPHDHQVSPVLASLRQAGVGVPGQLSVISFDNYHESHALSVTSVDFGFDYLGYAAFHKLHGVIDVRSSPEGGIAAIPSVAERGSVQQPRRGPLRVSV